MLWIRKKGRMQEQQMPEGVRLFAFRKQGKPAAWGKEVLPAQMKPSVKRTGFPSGFHCQKVKRSDGFRAYPPQIAGKEPVRVIAAAQGRNGIRS